MSALDFLVLRQNLRECKFAPAPTPSDADLDPGQILLRIDRFAFTSNNVTYAVFGDSMRYWAFFPGPTVWGRIPVWGFGDVIHSRHDAIAVGERVFGYLPMSTHVVLQPASVTEASFIDVTPHRLGLAEVYQRYRRSAHDPVYDSKHEDEQALLVPLFMTSCLIDDFLADNELFGAQAVVLSSASSKTALSLAFLLKRRSRCEVIGLTSPGNKAFCERVGYYDRVLPYEAMRSLPSERPTVLVDLAGSGKLLHAIHHHFRDNLKYSCIVGAARWEERETQHGLPGPEPTFFFAPDQIRKSTQQAGSRALMKRFGEQWRAFLPSVSTWMRVVHEHGAAAVKAVYLEVLEGKLKPEDGHVLTLHEDFSPSPY